MPGLASFQKGQKFTIYRSIYVINELVSGKKFTNARSLLFTSLLSPGSTVICRILKFWLLEVERPWRDKKDSSESEGAQWPQTWGYKVDLGAVQS